MSTPTSLSVPRIIGFFIGSEPISATGADTPTQQIGRVRRLPPVRGSALHSFGVIHGLVENFGTVDFLFHVEDSVDDVPAGGGTYVDHAIRVLGAAVSNGEFTVPAGGRVEFILEIDAATNEWLSFMSDNETMRYGHLTLCWWHGDLERHNARADTAS